MFILLKFKVHKSNAIFIISNEEGGTIMNDKFPEKQSSFWMDTNELLNYPKLQENIKVDVTVVGGGIAGITTAYMLASNGYKVALLEARKLANGTTGNTTAKLTAQHQLIYDELINRYGQEVAKLYYQANMEAIALVKNFSEKLAIDCELEEQDAYVYTASREKKNEIEKEAEAYQKLNIEGELLDDLPLDVQAEAAIVMRNQAQFHPVKYLNGLLHAFEKMGGQIYEHTMVKDVDNDEYAVCKTDQGYQVTSEHVVFATHYPTHEVDDFFPNHLDTESSYAIAIKAKKKFPGGMYINHELPKRTMRPLYKGGVEYILVGGESHTTGDGTSTEQRYKEIYEFADELFGVDQVINYWSSHDLISTDRLPFIGSLQPDTPNILVATGFNKWGLTNATIGAKLLTDLIAGNDNPYQSLYSLQRTIRELEEPTESTDDSQSYKKSSKVQETEHLQKNQGSVVELFQKTVGAYRDHEGELHLLDLSCTHRGCSVEWNDGDTTWDCPCHGSRFNALGEVIEGPALKPLKKIK